MTLIEVDRTRPEIPVVTLADPKRYNALSGRLVGQLQDALADVGADRQARVAVLRGAGKGFCSGADMSNGGVNEPAPGAEHRGKVGALVGFQEHLARLILAIAECPKPVVAAVHGAAVGGGFAIALACDIRVCATDARFGLRPVRLGLTSCELGASYLLPRVVGQARAAELMLSGRDFGALDAARIGLVHEVVETAALMDAAGRIAEQVAAHNEYSVWTTKVGLRAGAEARGLRHALALEKRLQVTGLLTGA